MACFGILVFTQSGSLLPFNIEYLILLHFRLFFMELCKGLGLSYHFLCVFYLFHLLFGPLVYFFFLINQVVLFCFFLLFSQFQPKSTYPS